MDITGLKYLDEKILGQCIEFLNEIINSIFENKYIRKDKYYKTIGINEFTKYIFKYNYCYS